MVLKLFEYLGKPFLFIAKYFLLILLSIAKIIQKTIVFLKTPRLIPKKTKRVVKKKIRFKLTLSYGVLFIFGISAFITTFFYFVILKDLPSPKLLKDRDQIVTTKIFDRHGTLLYKIYKNENRSLVLLSDLPPHLIEATIAIEDQEFYQHTGISVKGIARAIQRNIFENKIQGGSTITQQLVKNALLSTEKTITRKIKEVILAIGVELTYDKKDILQMYFNEVGYGGAIYGIGEASIYYFGKPAATLSLAESSLLAGLPAAPTAYSPFGANPEFALSRQHEVLRRMIEEEFISPQQATQAKSEKLTFIRPRNNITAPHFVMHVKDLLVRKFGESLVHQGGLSVITTLDANIQATAQKIIDDEIQTIKHLNVNNAALLITNPKTSEILSMIGSVDYFDIENDGQVNVVNRPRQPGSSIKPLTYALAFENNYLPSSTIRDTPITYRVPGSPPYTPRNYDGRFHGTITLKQALANSYNIPAVKLLSILGVNNLVEIAKDFGITTWNDSSRFGLSLTLGGGEITMFDLVTAYQVFANNGIKKPLISIMSVSDYKGDLLYQNPCINQKKSSNSRMHQETCKEQIVTSPLTAYQISDALSDNKARSSTFGPHSKLNIPNHQVAVKTGTTNELKDNWAIGYTQDYVVASWVGNNDNAPMSNIASGITGATPIWHNVMTNLLQKTTPHAFNLPENAIKTTICPLTNTLSCKACPNPSVEIFIKGEEPKYACNQEMIDRYTKPVENSQILEGASTQN